MPTKKQPKTRGKELDAVLQSRLQDLKAELEVTKAAFKDELFDWAVAALAGYLKGDFKSLDAAFKGSTGGRDRASYARSDEVAREIARERLSGAKWKVIAAERRMQPRQARREYTRGVVLLRQEEERALNARYSAPLIKRLEKSDARQEVETAASGRKKAEVIGAKLDSTPLRLKRSAR